jgi:hypothetical protein
MEMSEVLGIHCRHGDHIQIGRHCFSIGALVTRNTRFRRNYIEDAIQMSLPQIAGTGMKTPRACVAVWRCEELQGSALLQETTRLIGRPRAGSFSFPSLLRWIARAGGLRYFSRRSSGKRENEGLRVLAADRPRGF